MFSWTKRIERSSMVDAVRTAQVDHVLGTNTGLATTPTAMRTCEDAERSLKLLSFNIQVGIKTSKYRHYLTKGWKHVLPHDARQRNLGRIANVVADYDVVGLQEVDGGSIRSGFMNQVEYLAQTCGFPYWYTQLNRDMGPLAQHGNGLLTRMAPTGLEDHKLPGLIPGRGAVILRVPYAGDELVVVMLHLSLGERSRTRQLAYIAEQIEHERQVIIMGDMNTPMVQLLEGSPLSRLNLEPAAAEQPTYPSWAPAIALDHVLVTPNLVVSDYRVLPCRVSDHRPVAVEVRAKTRPALQ